MCQSCWLACAEGGLVERDSLYSRKVSAREDVEQGGLAAGSVTTTSSKECVVSCVVHANANVLFLHPLLQTRPMSRPGASRDLRRERVYSTYSNTNFRCTVLLPPQSAGMMVELRKKIVVRVVRMNVYVDVVEVRSLVVESRYWYWYWQRAPGTWGFGVGRGKGGRRGAGDGSRQ